MRRIFAWLAAALMLAAPALALGEGQAAGLLLSREDAPVQALRARPSDQAESLGLYFNGVTARAEGEGREGWVPVSIGSLKGWLREGDLSPLPQEGRGQEELPVVEVAYRDGPALTLRAAQSYKSEKLKGYANGTRMRLLGFTEDFVHVVAPDGRVGFMMAWGVTPQPTAEALLPAAAPEGEGAAQAALQPGAEGAQTQEPVPPEGAQAIRVRNQGGEGANLRRKASTGSESYGLYPNGSRVYLLKWGEWWCKVWADGHTGYMMTKMLTVQQQKDAPQKTEAPVDTEGLDALDDFDFVHWADGPVRGTPEGD